MTYCKIRSIPNLFIVKFWLTGKLTKVKVTLEQTMKAQRGVEVFLLNLDAGWGVGGQRHAPAALPLEKRFGTHSTRIGDWLGPRDGLEAFGKISPLPIFDPRPIQPVASRYTDELSRQHRCLNNSVRRMQCCMMSKRVKYWYCFRCVRKNLEERMLA
jgi:hypothetical protein